MGAEQAQDSPPQGGDDAAEVISARSVFRDLDKTWRATRTYGLKNTVTTRFFEQLEGQTGRHLGEWPVLAVVVDAAELRLRGEIVYRGEDSLGESLAFRLYGDGVRELRFEAGVSSADLHALLDALWATDNAPDVDDDVVTRLWSKDLTTISFVSAEDILQSPSSLELQEGGFFAPPPASFAAVIERELRAAHGGPGQQTAAAGSAAEQLQQARGGGVVGFEVTETERSAIARALALERTIDERGRVLSMLSAILTSERSPDLLVRAIAVVPAILDELLLAGDWRALLDVVAMLETAHMSNPAMGLTHALLAVRVIDSLSVPHRVTLLGAGLNADPPRPIAGLPQLLARLSPQATGALCGVLADTLLPEHRAHLRDALTRLGAVDAEPVLKALGHPRGEYVRDLIAVVVSWKQPQAVDVLAMLAGHVDRGVRADAVKGIAALRGEGDGSPLVAFAFDGDAEVRAEAASLLAAGRYLAPFDHWRPHLEKQPLDKLSRNDKRALFRALLASAGDSAVPYWQALLGERGWKHRKAKEENALLAVKALEALHTDAAHAALEAGVKAGSGPTRKACAAALSGRRKAAAQRQG